MAVLPFGEKKPLVSDDAFVHESAVVIGDVHIHERASVWPCAVIRADDARIEVGKGTGVLDLALLEAPSGKPVVVGDGCIISHGAKLHGCVVMSDSLIGIGAIVLDGATIGKGSVVAAGALVPPGTRIPPGSFVIGVPGKVTREASTEEHLFVEREVRHLFEKTKIYRARA